MRRINLGPRLVSQLKDAIMNLLVHSQAFIFLIPRPIFVVCRKEHRESLHKRANPLRQLAANRIILLICGLGFLLLGTPWRSDANEHGYENDATDHRDSSCPAM